jgi:hypothetical protein
MASSRPPRPAAPPSATAPPAPSAAPVAPRPAAPPSRPADALEPGEHETIYAVFGNTTRAGPWLPPDRLRVVALFGSVTLDFRRADLPPGVTELEVWSVCGSVEIHVPADLEAELDGFALLGSVEQRAAKGGKLRAHARRLLGMDDPAAEIDEDPRPEDEAFLEIRGNALLGSVLLKIDA